MPSYEPSERVLGALRIARVTHGLGTAASVASAITMALALPEMDTAKVVVFFVMAFFSILIPTQLLRRRFHVSKRLQLARTATCLTVTMQLVCVGLIIHSMVISVTSRGISVPSSRHWVITLAPGLVLGLTIFSLFVHCAAQQMLSEVKALDRLSHARKSLRRLSVGIGDKAKKVRKSMVGYSDVLGVKATKPRQHKPEAATTATATPAAVKITVVSPLGQVIEQK